MRWRNRPGEVNKIQSFICISCLVILSPIALVYVAAYKCKKCLTSRATLSDDL